MSPFTGSVSIPVLPNSKVFVPNAVLLVLISAATLTGAVILLVATVLNVTLSVVLRPWL